MSTRKSEQSLEFKPGMRVRHVEREYRGTITGYAPGNPFFIFVRWDDMKCEELIHYLYLDPVTKLEKILA